MVGLVLAGGGARGAYEMGALAVLAPALEARGERVRIIVGTSAGALNAAFLAARATGGLAAAAADGMQAWRTMTSSGVLGRVLSAGEAVRVSRALLSLCGLPVSADGLLDTSPLAATIPRLIDFEQLAVNVRSGELAAAAVVTTPYATGRSTVFVSGGSAPAPDGIRGIDYVEARLGAEHVLASASIPVLFPATHITTPGGAAGWYGDGGIRLNTPLKPALSLGVDRLIVIGLTAVRTRPQDAVASEPDLLDGASSILGALLADQLARDVATLATINEVVASEGAGASGRRLVPYVFVAPQDRFAVGRLAVEVYREHYAGIRAGLRCFDLRLLGWALGARRNAVRGDLFSSLFFAPEFAAALIDLGRRDARRWLDAAHEDGIWQHGRLPLPDAGSP